MHRTLRSKEKASKHLQAGARKVLISAPANDADATVVYGVNEKELTPEQKLFQMHRALRIV